MYLQLAECLCVTNGTDQSSQAVSMAGANAVQLSAVIMTLGGATNMTFYLEGTNDLENWSNITSWTSLTAGFNKPSGISAATGIAWQYVRVRYSVATGTGTAQLTCGFNTASL